MPLLDACSGTSPARALCVGAAGLGPAAEGCSRTDMLAPAGAAPCFAAEEEEGSPGSQLWTCSVTCSKHVNTSHVSSSKTLILYTVHIHGLQRVLMCPTHVPNSEGLQR